MAEKKFLQSPKTFEHTNFLPEMSHSKPATELKQKFYQQHDGKLINLQATTRVVKFNGNITSNSKYRNLSWSYLFEPGSYLPSADRFEKELGSRDHFEAQEVLEMRKRKKVAFARPRGQTPCSCARR